MSDEEQTAEKSTVRPMTFGDFVTLVTSKLREAGKDANVLIDHMHIVSPQVDGQREDIEITIGEDWRGEYVSIRMK